MNKRLMFTLGGRPDDGSDTLAVILDEENARTWLAVLRRYLERADRQWPIYMAEMGKFEEWPEPEPAPEPADAP